MKMHKKCKYAQDYHFLSEISNLQMELTEAHARIAILESELNAASCKEVITIGIETDPDLDTTRDSEGKSRLSPVPSPRTKSPKLLPTSPNRDYTELLRKHNAARLIIEDLVNKNVALNKELSVSKQELTNFQSKLSLMTEQLQTERVLHAESIKEIQNLQDRVNDLLSDRDRCETLTAEVIQLKESKDRLKREHAHQLHNLDKVGWVFGNLSFETE